MLHRNSFCRRIVLMARKEFLTVYDYAHGGRWRIATAQSREQIERELSQVRVMDGPPHWMTEGELAAVEVVDIDSKDDDFHNRLRREA